MRTKLELTASGRVLILLASLALCAAWTTGGEAARLGACMLVAPLLADWALKIKRCDGVNVLVSRRRTRAGAPFLERVVLRNRSRHDLWHATFGEQGLVASSRGQSALLECLPRGRDLEVELPVRARGRGVTQRRAFWLMTQHPLGLVRMTAQLDAEAAVVSEPARTDVTALLRQRRADEGFSDDAALGSDGESFYALRELRDGEDVSRVHALRSAALGTPVRVLSRGAARARVRVVVDLRSPPARGARRSARTFEWSLSAACSLVEQLLAAGRCVDVDVLGQGVRRFPALGQASALAALLEFLAQAQPVAWHAADDEFLAEIALGRETFFIASGGFLSSHERERLGAQVVVWEGQAA